MTESTININNLHESQPSLCIPRVFKNISEARIRKVFDDLKLGNISRIDINIRKNENGDEFKRVYIHFHKWFWNEEAQLVRTKLVSGKEIKIVYDDPWFWKVSASRWKPRDNSESKPTRPIAHIEFDDGQPWTRVNRSHEDRRPRNDRRQHVRTLQPKKSTKTEDGQIVDKSENA
jgi:hypothetical protein